MKEFYKDNLKVKIMPDRSEMGIAAAEDIRMRILALLKDKAEVNMVFAAAPSQNEVLAALCSYGDIPWDRINAYHMDEYIGLPDEYRDKSFGTYLTEHILGRVKFRSVNLINALALDAEAECARYAELLMKNPVDIVVMGIGENGHIAFNDPWVAKFDDDKSVKVVMLDEMCRQQQVNDGCFPSIDCVPKYAITLTCPMLVSAPHLFCVVPASTKAGAVKRTVTGEINEECPATLLRRQPDATLYLDDRSSALL